MKLAFLKRIFLSPGFLPVLIFGCNNSSTSLDKVKIENKLNKSIVCVLGYNYPDLNLGFINKQSVLTNIKFEINAGQTKELDTLGLCQKATWDKYIKHNMLMLFVFDKDKLQTVDKVEDALTERYYFSYIQLMKTNGIITVN